MPQDNVISIRVVVKDDGSIALKQVAQSTEDLGKKAAAGSEGMVKLNAAGAEARGIFQGLGQEGAGLLGRFGGLLTVLGPVGIGLGAAAYAATTAVSAFTGFASQVRDLSFLSGGSTRDTSVLVAGLEHMGVSSGAVEIAMRAMSAAVENGSPVLNKLKISLIDMSGAQKTGLTLFYETIDALRAMPNEMERNRLSQQLFGRSFLELILAIQRGSGAIKELGEASGKFLTAEDLERAKQYTLAVAEVGEVWDRAKINLGRGIIAPITFVLKWLGTAGEETTPYEESKRIGEAFGMMFPQKPSAPPLESYFASEAAMQANVFRQTGMQAPPFDIQALQRKIFESQTMQMQAAARATLATSPAAILSAQADALRAALRGELAKFAIEAHAQGLTDEQISPRRIALTAQTNAAIEKLTRDSLLRQAEPLIKFYDDSQAMAEKQYEARVKIEQDITGATLNENDKRLREVETWQETSLKSIQSVYGESLEGASLITAVYAESGRRRVEIEIETARKIGDALKGQTDTFEEAYRLQGQPVTLDWDRYYAGFLKQFSDAQTKFQNALTAPIQMRAMSLGGPQLLPYAEYEDRLTKIGITAQLIGRQYFDPLSKSISETQSTLEALVANGVDPASERMQGLKTRLADLQDQFERREMFRNVFDELSSGIADSVRGVAQGTQTMGQLFTNLGYTVQASLLNMIVKNGLQKLDRYLEDWLTENGGFWARLFGFGAGAMMTHAPLEGTTAVVADILRGSGGILPGTFAPLRRFAWGGISDGPMLGMIGEGRYPREAVIPMPDGRSVPVTFTGPASNEPMKLTVNVINESGVPLAVKQTTTRRSQSEQVAQIFIGLTVTNPDVRAAIAAVR
jgi:hypothetical protein